MKIVMTIIFLAAFIPTVSKAQFQRVYITDIQDFDQLGLIGNNPQSQNYIQRMRQVFIQNFSRANFVMLLAQNDDPSNNPKILTPDLQFKLEGLMNISKKPRCFNDTFFKVTTEEILVGGSIDTMSKGICGAILTIHSLVKLGLVPAAQAYVNGFINERAIKKITTTDLQADPLCMSVTEMVNAHKAFGARRCEVGQRVDTGNAPKLKKELKALDKLMNGPRKWDCTMLVESQSSTEFSTLSHAEHIKSFDPATGTITTANGLAQGNQTTTVPVDAGTSSWNFTPGGAPAGSFTSSTHEDNEKYKAAIPPVNFVQFICCRP